MGMSTTYEPNDDRMRHTIREIFRDYGDIVVPKGKSLLKFGKTDLGAADTQTLLWSYSASAAFQPRLTANSVISISSSNSGDTQSVTIEGHTWDGTNLNFLTQNITLQGQTEVSLTTPLRNCTRIKNNGSSDFAGNIYVYESVTVTAGVPQTASKVHAYVPAGNTNSTLQAASAISGTDYYAISNISFGIERNASGAADFDFQIGPVGGVMRTVAICAGHTQGQPVAINFDPFLIVPKNHDFRLIGTPSAINMVLHGNIDGYLLTTN